MRNNYFTTAKNALCLIGIYLTLFFMGSLNAHAGFGDIIDFGQMELNKDYKLEADFSDYQGYFVAPKSGMLTVVSTSGCLMSPYEDAEFTRPIDYNHSFLTDGKESYDMNVVSGRKYYLFKSFSMNEGILVLQMEDNPNIELKAVSPEEGATYSVGKGSNIIASFNKAVIASSAEIAVGSQSTDIEFNIQGSNILVEPKTMIMDFLNNGQLKAGETFQLIIKGICAANNNSVKYGTDGTLSLTFVCGPKPISLVKTEGIEDNRFLSYWLKGDEQAILKFEFDGALLSSKGREDEALLKITYGNTERGNSEMYTEVIPYEADGNTILIDLSEKLRRPKDMLDSGSLYPEVYLQLESVRDAQGEYAYNPVSGTIGSYSFTMAYEEVKADIVSEFSPAPGSSLADTKELEIWITDYEKIRHQGIAFLCESGTTSKNVMVEDFTAVPDPDFESAYILNVSVPQEAQEAERVIVSLADAQFKDGIDHSDATTASFTNKATSVSSTLIAPKQESVYSLSGAKLRHSIERSLPTGVYIIGSKKKLHIQ